MKKNLLLFCFLLAVFRPEAQTLMQTADSAYKKPLREVLADIEIRFGVKIKYSEDMIRDRWVTYADWRFRRDADQTLANILAPLDMKVNKEGDKRYKLKYYEYARRTPEEGAEELKYLSTLYQDRESWEKRKGELLPCMWAALQLSTLPVKPASKAITTPRRVMNGYTVENVAIETLPGLYVSGSLYRPLHSKGKIPVILSPDGHFAQGRYRSDCQYRCATLARMGAMVFSYDLFAWGESLLQFREADHRRSLAMTIQVLNSIRILDYMLALKDADKDRVGITGGSGGGSQTTLMTALDNRIKVCVPVVSLSSFFYGGCPCESGMPVHLCGGGTNVAEIGAMAAPRPQLVVSDGKDWTDHLPQLEYPYLQKMYGFYGRKELVQNVHLPQEGHDYGISKRKAMYPFMAQYLALNLSAVQGKNGEIDESGCTIEPEPAMYVFGEKGERLPANAIKSFEQLEQVFKASVRHN